MATITIHDEATRAVAWKALWSAAGSEIIDGAQSSFSDLFYETGWQAIGAVYGRSSEEDPGQTLHEKFVLLDELRAAAERLMVASCGDEVVLPFAAEEIASGLDDLITYVQNEESGFWNLDDARRQWSMQCVDAAKRLASEFKVEAVA